MPFKWGPKSAMRLRRRVAAVLGTMVLATGIVVATGGPALASTGDLIYLANAQSYGMYAANGVTSGSEIAVKTKPWGTWALVPVYSTLDIGYYFTAITTSGSVSNWCVATTATVVATLRPCGANGTVYIPVASGDGFLLYSRYFSNRGQDVVLGVCGVGNGSPVQAIPLGDVGGSCFGRWLDYYGTF